MFFPLFSDLHTENVDHPYARALIEALDATTDAISCDLAVDLGDNFSMLGRKTHISNENLQHVGEELLGRIAAAAGCPMLYPNGNHDAPGTDFYSPAFWNGVVKGRFANAGTGYDGIGSYCYLDHEPSDTRLVVLSCPYDSRIEEEYPTPEWAMGKAQLRWLRDQALDTTHNVILLMHVPPFFWYHGDETPILHVFTGNAEPQGRITFTE